MDFEKELEQVAQQYRDEGYTVFIHPSGDQFDGLPGDPSTDILATRGNEKVLVEVKRKRSDLAADPNVIRRAEQVNARPGWRFDLVILERETLTQRILEQSQEPTGEQFAEMLDRARRAKGAGLNEMALTYACAALEAAMRRLSEEDELYGQTTPVVLLRTLYANGFFSRGEFDLAKEAWAIRTQVVHGFIPPEIDPVLVEDLITLAKKVMSRAEATVGPAVG
ncbi:hypothetical protein [Fimbriiglobus ruber]|uniref:REase AHJR-like domain-containing protein n=1 Tax=Fimbriiglobus ruber TaxID=1908690 RepID=A0A225D6R0_9BACT|nr:hypothetical protein [Fimbriiglobus ruber]OWK36673.1 hypothetical protein FRUB_09236 [Fimbriiglobus ruber]